MNDVDLGGERRGSFGSVMLCLTTLRHQRFVEDVVNLIALPFGAYMRLRYAKDYVCTEAWRLAEGGLAEGHSVLIALGGSSDVRESAVVPLRFARLVRASCQGSLLVLDVALAEFALEGFPNGHFWPAVRAAATGLPEDFHPSKKVPGTYLTFLKRRPTSLIRGSGVGAWEKVANRVLELDGMVHQEGSRCIPFLYFICGLSRHATRNLGATGRLTMDAGSDFEFDLHSLTKLEGKVLREPRGEILVELSHPSASFVTTRRLRIDSSRDVKRIQIVSSSAFRSAHGHLSFRLVEFRPAVPDSGEAVDGLKPAQDRKHAVVARYDLPLVVGRWRPFAASLGLAVSSALLAWDPPGLGEVWEHTLIRPTLVGALAFLALSFGFWKDGKSN